MQKFSLLLFSNSYRILRRVFFAFIVLAIIGTGVFYMSMRLSLYDGETEGTLLGLSESVTVDKDRFGVPVITAAIRLDAFSALGYVTAKDRLFQMDLLRRQSAGRLAEIFGEAAVPIDLQQRTLGFEDVAGKIVQQLPAAQRDALQAYSNGVNSAIDSMGVMPFEFLLLGYRPDRWRAEDSILIVLSMFAMLDGSEREERMLTVMEQSLPAEVFEFLTPETDWYTQAILGELPVVENLVPIEALTKSLHPSLQDDRVSFVQTSLMQPGSNAWAVAGAKTKDGRAILANDMHLSISVPNIWYQCQLRYGEREIVGVNLPGTPLIIAGATRHLAWGMTALLADILDLVTIEINPENPDEYLTPGGWRSFEIRHESIQVKGALPSEHDIKTTIWGPVASESLLGQPVAIHWTAMDPEAVDIGLIDIDQMETLEQGLALMNTTGGPPLNVILADNKGRVGWSIMGRLPLRAGFSGMTSQSWANGSKRWDGYILPADLPRSVDPLQDFIVSANNRSVDKNYPHRIGHAFANGYRAFRVTEYLQVMDQINETNMLQIQLDTMAGIYGIYRDIALEVLTSAALVERPDRRELRDYLMAWDGKADVDSLGLSVIIQFRDDLAKAVFESLLYSSHMLDSEFEYYWTHLDVPLQALIKIKDPKLLPEQHRYMDWDAFLLAKLEESVQTLFQKYSINSLDALSWGKVNVVEYSHPLSHGIPGIGMLLNFPQDALPGCDFCVRVDSAAGAASERFVVSPSHWEDGILHFPGGQSGHPLSKHYKDQYSYWLQGRRIALMPSESVRRLILTPSQ